MIGRIPVLDISPVVACGQRPAKAVVGEAVPVAATAFRDGHGAVAVDAVLHRPDGTLSQRVRLSPGAPGTDRFHGHVRPDTAGDCSFTIEAWSDPVATWRHRARIKVEADMDVELELEEGAQLLERAADSMPKRIAGIAVVRAAAKALRDTKRPPQARLAHALDPSVAAALDEHPLRDLVTAYGPNPLRVERKRALFGSWYELFPRSEGATISTDGTVHSGTFRSAAKRFPAIAAMGFDVVYLPPIHPIGRQHRKGPNNTLTPGPSDPGSPWAIGSADGGHDAIHPDLGDERDFAHLVSTARKHDLEIALDLALQAAPDHPWVTEHPEWFTARADGSIAYAENPPKKYQDIYPIDFDRDPDGLYAEILRIVQLWISRDVRIFRVDNPHTKPVNFWQRLIAEINAQDPDVIFLAEAFTRPAMMRALAEVGFQQSYTYFTWRTGRDELIEYFTELSGPASAYMRPNVFTNTPDILHEYLQYGGPAAFAIRAALAATLSPTWGVYAGYELFEHVAVRPGSEEYLDSEKYQIRIRDWEGAELSGMTLAPFITSLNNIRRSHPALQQLRNLTFHLSSTDRLIAYSKRDNDDVVLTVVALDPHGVCEGVVTLDMAALGLGPDENFVVSDELSGATYTWTSENFVRLDPRDRAAHIFTVRGGA
jgi:starch synthase (maltosyl-transferring)